MDGLITDLLDCTRTRLGRGIEVVVRLRSRARRSPSAWRRRRCRLIVGTTSARCVRRASQARGRRIRSALLVALPLLLPATAAHAQWVPKGSLAAVHVVDDCHETGGDVMVSRLDPPTIYVCPSVIRRVRREHPGAEHFFYVHEFGHIALQTSDEAAADCWAAKELAQAPNGRRFLDAAIALFRQRRDRSDEASVRYGAPGARAERILACAEEEPSPRPRLVP